MNTRERLNAVLHYRDYDRLPVVHFGFWGEVVEKWIEDGFFTVMDDDGVIALHRAGEQLPRRYY